MMSKKAILMIISCFLYVFSINSQTIKLNLSQCVRIASDSSLYAFRSKHMYQSSYWEYRSYKADRLPALNLKITPIQYNRNMVKRYDYNENIEIYREQQSLFSSGGVSINQNFDLTGGTFFVDSELGYLKNYGDNNYTQFSSTPIRIGYSQALFGFNRFKWEKKIEPLKFERAKKQLLFSQEEIAENTTQYFFDLALAQEEYNMAYAHVLTSDTLYNVGLERQKISAISQADILTLELDVINAQNTFKNVELNLKRAKFSLLSFLNLDRDSQIAVDLPYIPNDIIIAEADAFEYARRNNPDYLEYKQEILEAERDFDKSKKASLFDASVSASIGFNQVANNFSGVYQRPLQQDVFAVSITIPIVDWGVKKGRTNMAKSNLSMVKLSAEQKERDLEQDVITTLDNFNLQQELISSAEKAMSLASAAYNNTKLRFAIGKSDVNSLALSLNRQKEAHRNYISTLRYYWLSYYKIRKLTLFDFEKQEHLSVLFDRKLNAM